MLDLEEYSHIDHLFARHLLKSEDHPLYSFCLELMKASREGHLFIEKETLDPSIDVLINQPDSPIIKEGNVYYLRRNYYHEEEIANHLSEKINLPRLSGHIPVPEGLNKKQAKAFELLNTSPFFLITGGPGSGKSFVARSIVKAYKTAYPGKKIICTAPTGKALSALSESGEESLTLHKLLNIREGFEKQEKKTYIIADLLIIDECSMISPKLFNILLSSLLNITQVILIGDPHQLPPVSGASIFYDFTTLKGLDKVHLSAPMRSDKQAIINFAKAILDEDEEMITKILNEKNEITLKPLDQFKMASQKENHILLTPFRKGPYGSLELNEQVRPKKGHPVPIMITKNDTITGLTNGDIGFINDEVATFPEKNLSLPLLMLPAHEKAFALSIHKSQGSEFDHITIILPEEATCFQKELLFTAITRAKKSIQIYSSPETLMQLVRNKTLTLSRLSQKVRLTP